MVVVEAIEGGGGMGIVFVQIKDSPCNSPDRAGGMLVSAALVTDNFTTNATFLVGKSERGESGKGEGKWDKFRSCTTLGTEYPFPLDDRKDLSLALLDRP